MKNQLKKGISCADKALCIAYNNFSSEDLNNNAHFNTTLVFAKNSALHDHYKLIQQAFIDELCSLPIPEGLKEPIASGLNRERISRRNVETLLANLFNMQAKGHKTVALSLDHKKYANTKLSGTGLVNLIKLAAHKSRLLLGLKQGFQDLANPKNSRSARIRPTRRLWALIDSTIVSEDDLVSMPHDLINLRKTIGKGKDKQKIIIPRKEWSPNLSPELWKWLHIIEISLKWFNIVYGEYEMTYTAESGKHHYLFPTLYAVYTDDFYHGGRFYTGKGGHQSLTKAERKTIKLNGHKTVELDFGGLHLRMLYHFAGLNYPLNQCPYEAILRAMGKNDKRLFAKYPELKDDLKMIVFGMVNGTIKNRKNLFAEAVNRTEYRLFNNLDEGKDIRQERRDRWKQLNLLDSNNKPTSIVKAFEKAHKPLQNSFYSGCGLGLQNIDSKIAYWIMCGMMFENEEGLCTPTLPIHDSFITFSEYESQLKNTMKSVYQAVIQQCKNTNKKYNIPVKS